jgi:glycosyltransferase involved in cell wall biosynthesis
LRKKDELVLQSGLKICLLTSSFPSNARDQIAAPFLPPFIAALQDCGAQVVVYTQDRPGRKQPVVDVPIYWFPWGHSDMALSQLKPYVPSHLWKMRRLAWNGCQHVVPFLREHHVDLCLAAWTIPSGYFAYQARKVLGIPYCVWALGSDIYSWGKYPLFRHLITHILQHADGLFADGFDLATQVQHLASRHCAFLPSMRPLVDDVPPATISIDTTKINFLFIGRWEKVKGVDVLIEAMKLLSDAEVAAHLYIIGKGSLKSLLEQKIRAYALTESVFLRENLPTATLREYLQQCDCVVIPSRSDSIPLVFSEALQARRPLIVSEVGDLATLVQRFELGLVVPPENPEELKQALEVFAHNRHRSTQYLRRIDEAKTLFNLDKAAAAFLRRATEIVNMSFAADEERVS